MCIRDSFWELVVLAGLLEGSRLGLGLFAEEGFDEGEVGFGVDADGVVVGGGDVDGDVVFEEAELFEALGLFEEAGREGGEEVEGGAVVGVEADVFEVCLLYTSTRCRLILLGIWILFWFLFLLPMGRSLCGMCALSLEIVPCLMMGVRVGAGSSRKRAWEMHRCLHATITGKMYGIPRLSATP